MDLSYSYIKKRKDFGQQPRFCEVSPYMLDSITPNLMQQKQYCLRNPVNQTSQVSISQSECEVNTKRIIFKHTGVNHAEGGWPNDVHFADEELTSRYRRRVERDEAYIDAVLDLCPKIEHYINQNNAIEMYELYYENMPQQIPVEKLSIRLNNVYKDIEDRDIGCLSWTHEEDSKLVVTYCNKKYPLTQPVNNNLFGYVWDLESPFDPVDEFHPPSACWQVVSSPVHPSIIIGGLEDGRTCIFDLRSKNVPVAMSSIYVSHRDPVTSLMYVYSRLHTEFFTGSTDGQCMWWDVRNISVPIDKLIMSVFIPTGKQISLANAEPVSTLQYERSFPAKFLCGTDTGLVISVNRKGKSHKEILNCVFSAHNGPVKALHRSPCTSKMFITCGDWTVHIWSEDITSSPIVCGKNHRHQINDVVWAPQRVSSYMTASADGKFRLWDLLRKYREQVLVLPLSKYPLLKIKPHNEGRFIAVGDKKGIVYLIALSENLIVSGDKDKQLMSQLYERESRREHILETRVKEIRLKLKADEDAAKSVPAEVVDEEHVLIATENEYRRMIQEEFQRAGITHVQHGKNKTMRKSNYLQRLELFHKAIQAYDEALRWNNADVRSLLGRSLARAKMTHYRGALADAAQAAELEPENMSAKQICAQVNYEKCAFERALVLASRGMRIRSLPPDFAECARHAEETIRQCVGPSASKTLSASVSLFQKIELKRDSIEDELIKSRARRSRLQPQASHQVQEISRAEKQKLDRISRLMTSKYLGLMAHDKYFLTTLCKDERLPSANKQGSRQLQELASKALEDVEKRQAVLRVRQPMYAALAAGAEARARLSKVRKAQLTRAQQQHAKDARRLIRIAKASFEEGDTAKCLENAEFAMEQISRKPGNLMPDKEKFLQELYIIVANAFLDQKRVKKTMSESDREKRAFILLGMYVSREPSRDSVLRARPPAPPRDYRRRLRVLERILSLSVRSPERCYLLHEIARIYVETKQAHRARFYLLKCQSECRAANQRVWLLNVVFLLARCHLLQNNRPEARATLIEGAALSRSYGYDDIAEFYDTCVNVSLEGEVSAEEAELEKREKEMVGLMQDDDLRSAAEHLFRRMSVIPAGRRFSIMPGTRAEESAPQYATTRRISIIPQAQRPTKITHKSQHPLGFQEFDF